MHTSHNKNRGLEIVAIDLYWEDDTLTTLLCVFDGRWTWEELRATFKTIHKITDDVQHEVAAIIDVRKMQIDANMIFSAQGLAFAQEVLRMGKNGTGSIVVIGTNKVLKSIFETMCNLDRHTTAKVHFVDNKQQAREKLGLPTV